MADEREAPLQRAAVAAAMADALPGMGEVVYPDWASPFERWWGAGTDRQPLEVDVVAESTDRGTLFVGEAKLRLSAGDAAHVQRELDDRARRVPFAASNPRVVTGIFAAEVEDAAAVPGVILPDDVLAACR